MLRKRPVLGMALVLILAAVGCGPPVLAVRHRLAPDLPLPAGATRVGVFAVTAEGEDAYAAFVAETLTERLEAG
ncbi:MAG: hypothetical protein WBD75_09585, partial [Phycisphaerae bacterium]